MRDFLKTLLFYALLALLCYPINFAYRWIKYGTPIRSDQLVKKCLDLATPRPFNLNAIECEVLVYDGKTD